MNWRRGLFRLWIVGAALFPTSNAFAQSKDVAYHCVGEAAAGLSYNEKTKKWEATAFFPLQDFVLKMKFRGARVWKERTVLAEQVSDYKVTVTECLPYDMISCAKRPSGESMAIWCRNAFYFGDDPNKTVSDDPDKTVTVSDRLRTFSCANFSYDYQFNLGTNRFLATYPHGYTDSRGTNAVNDPFLEVGKCTKID